MEIKNRDIEKFRLHLMEWRGGGASFNAFSDDHDRLIVRLSHPTGEKEPVGLSLFYCNYLAGPIRWSNSNLDPKIWIQPDGVAGLELTDQAVGFVVRCATAALYGEPGIIIPRD